MKVHWLFHRFMKPEDDGGSAGGGAVDRGDDFTPTGDDALPVKKGEPKAAAAADDADDEDEKKPEPKAKGAAIDPDEDEGEEEGDDGKGEEKPKRKDSRIPVGRHKEILAKERERREALEREVAQLKQGKQVADTNEEITKAETRLVSLEAEYNKLLIDGEAEKASAKMREIRQLERGIVEKQTEMRAQHATALALDQVRYENTLERLETAYPQLNPDHDDYDQELTGEVIELRDGYIATGKYSRAEALQKAVKNLIRPATTRQKAATDTDVRLDADDKAKAEQLAEKRLKDQRKKNLDTMGKQPADTSKVGMDSDKLGGKLNAKLVMGMSQDEFAKLNEADLARLRGDELVQ